MIISTGLENEYMHKPIHNGGGSKVQVGTFDLTLFDFSQGTFSSLHPKLAFFSILTSQQISILPQLTSNA